MLYALFKCTYHCLFASPRKPVKKSQLSKVWSIIRTYIKSTSTQDIRNAKIMSSSCIIEDLQYEFDKVSRNQDYTHLG